MPSNVDELASRLGANWLAIKNARSETTRKRDEIAKALASLVVPDTSVVLFGSIAREEMTTGSDSDWILLVDGQAMPEHLEAKHKVASKLKDLGIPEPGKSGVFGGLVGSHDIVHQIGGEDDSNSNTTRRVLLLLESFPVGHREAYDRVRRQILNRYLKDDRGLVRGTGPFVPRFLLNDLTRYWRTITVDFVYKQRTEAGRKWALRNIKLRMSRKLVFASGLLRCFLCQLDPSIEEIRKSRDISGLLSHLEQRLAQTPLDVLAEAALRPSITNNTRQKLFDNYDRFLAILDDASKREELEKMKEEEMQSSQLWQKVRGLSHDFHEGLISLFFRDDPDITHLTTQYAVF